MSDVNTSLCWKNMANAVFLISVIHIFLQRHSQCILFSSRPVPVPVPVLCPLVFLFLLLPTAPPRLENERECLPSNMLLPPSPISHPGQTRPGSRRERPVSPSNRDFPDMIFFLPYLNTSFLSPAFLPFFLSLCRFVLRFVVPTLFFFFSFPYPGLLA